MSNRSALTALLGIALAACAGPDLRSTMSEAQALKIAADDARARNIDLTQFGPPSAQYVDGNWLVSYDGLDGSIVGNHFGYSISRNMVY